MMFSKIKYREGTATVDGPKMAELFQDHFKTAEKDFYNTDLDYTLDYWKELEEKGNLVGIVAESDNEIIGYIVGQIHGHAYMRTKRFATLDLFYLAPEHRSLNVGKGLIDFTEKVLKEKSVNYINFNTLAKLKLEKYFKLLGYKPSAITLTKRLL